MKETFDLTTQEGFSELAVKIASSGLDVYNNVVDGLNDLFKPSVQKQAEAAERLIRAGKQNGVDIMEITMSKEAGVKLKNNLGNKFNIETLFGSNEITQLKVKYK